MSEKVRQGKKISVLVEGGRRGREKLTIAGVSTST